MLRTYTRKPQECRYIEGVMGLCRLCLGAAETAVPIFTDDPANICSSLAMRIMICVGLDVKRDDNLPNLVCGNCYKELERYYTFRKRCEVSYQKLKSHLKASCSRHVDTTTENVEILTEVGVNQDENMNINDFGVVMMGEAVEISKVVPEAGPVISDVHTVAATNSEVQQEQQLDLSALMASVLVKLGVLAVRRGRLAVLRPDVAVVQLETAGGRVAMRLEEEDDEETESQTSNSKSEALMAELEPVARPSEPLARPPAPDAGPPALVARPPEPVARPPEPVPKPPEPVPKATFIEPKKKTTKTHTNVGAVPCAECGRVLASRSAWRRHLRVHSGERPFPCPRCDRAFTQKEVMLRHQLVHDEVRPHKCSTCNKSFTQRNALQLHERSHLPPHERALALHSCPHCPKLFLYGSGLSRHMMTHSGRVYVCGTCRRQFADKSSVLRHHRARHPDTAEPDTEGDTSDTGKA